MSDRIFDRDTMLDLSVNFIPLGILLFFVLVFFVLTPFPSDPLILLVQMSLVIIPGIALLMLTYYSGNAIEGSRDDEEGAGPGYSEADAEVARSTGEE